MALYYAGIPNNINNHGIKHFFAKTGMGPPLPHQGGVPNDIIGVKSVGEPPLNAWEVFLNNNCFEWPLVPFVPKVSVLLLSGMHT